MAPRSRKRRMRKKMQLQRNRPILSSRHENSEVPFIITAEVERSVDQKRQQNGNRNIFDNNDFFSQQAEEVHSIIFEQTPVQDITSEINTKRNKITRFQILETTISLMKSDCDRDRFNCILQNLFTILAAPEEERELCYSLLNSFIGGVKDLGPKKFSFVSEKCAEVLLSKELLNIIIDAKNVQCNNLIAQGGYGIVMRGKICQATGSNFNVAIKSSKTREKETFLLREAVTMSCLKHNNIVTILGFVKKPMQILIEYMELGDLSKCLGNYHVSLPQLHKMLIDIVTGMEYLAEKQFIHRDLATKNIFVNRRLECKIGDFGLSCYINDSSGFYEEKSGFLYMYNTAPEAKLNQTFSIKSDVWAMGLVIWEMFYLKEFRDSDYDMFPVPYILHEFCFTYKLPFSPLSPFALTNYTIEKILHPDPNRRPTFTEMKKFIMQFL